MIFDDPKFDWKKSEDIRPYVFVRPENKIESPGQLHSTVDWFPKTPIYKNPLDMEELGFGDRILYLEAKAFGPSGMAMPRWVFYDCAIVPGFVAGYAARTSKLSESVKKKLLVDDSVEWTPLSLFIIIPTMSREGEWVAHNLCSVNSLLDKPDRFYGLGFLSKAFGLWYANVKICCGFTQWGNPAVKLHAYYGEFEVLTSYTPIHSHAKTLTYRVKVNPDYWPNFFTKEPLKDLGEKLSDSGVKVDPTDEESLISLQKQLQEGKGPYFLRPSEVITKGLDEPLTLYRQS